MYIGDSGGSLEECEIIPNDKNDKVDKEDKNDKDNTDNNHSRTFNLRYNYTRYNYYNYTDYTEYTQYTETETGFENGCMDFISEKYDLLCGIALKRLAANKTPSVILDEVKNNFKIGIIKSDWRLSETECRAKIDASKSASEKNYWISMLKLIMANNEINQINQN